MRTSAKSVAWALVLAPLLLPISCSVTTEGAARVEKGGALAAPALEGAARVEKGGALAAPALDGAGPASELAAATPEGAFEILRHAIVTHDFSRYWYVMTDAAREDVAKDADKSLADMLNQVKAAHESDNPQDKAVAEEIVRITGGRTIEQLRKLGVIEQAALLSAIADAVADIAQPGSPIPHKVFKSDSMIVGKDEQGNSVTLTIENQWKYRRKRSELEMEKEGSTWRIKGFNIHAFGKLALGPEGLTVPDEKKKELVESVLMMIRTPAENGKATFDGMEILEIGPVAAPAALEVVAGASAGERDRKFAALVLQILSEEAAPVMPDLKKMLASGDEKAAAACDIMGKMGRAAAGEVPALIELFRGGGPESSSAAAGAIGAIRARPDISIPALVEVISAPDKRPGSLEAAIRAVCQFDEDAASAVEPLSALLGHKEPRIRGDAAAALGLIGKPALGKLPAIRTAAEIEKDELTKFRMGRVIERMKALAGPQPDQEIEIEQQPKP